MLVLTSHEAISMSPLTSSPTATASSDRYLATQETAPYTTATRTVDQMGHIAERDANSTRSRCVYAIWPYRRC